MEKNNYVYYVVLLLIFLGGFTYLVKFASLTITGMATGGSGALVIGVRDTRNYNNNSYTLASNETGFLTNHNVWLNFTPYENVTGYLNVTTATTNPVSNNFSGKTEADLYLTVHTNLTFNWTDIWFTYTDADITTLNINESTLRVYRYNESADEWQVLYSGVNETENRVYGRTYNFSNFGVFGDSISSSSTQSSSGGGASASGSGGGGGGGTPQAAAPSTSTGTSPNPSAPATTAPSAPNDKGSPETTDQNAEGITQEVREQVQALMQESPLVQSPFLIAIVTQLFSFTVIIFVLWILLTRGGSKE